MIYTIKEFAAKVGVSAYTIRYYDKEGLLPFVTRTSNGYRHFTQADLNIFKTVLCLKNTNMPVKTIKEYTKLIVAGPDTIADRLVLLEAHQAQVKADIEALQQNLAEIEKKITKYRQPNAREVVQNELEQANWLKTIAEQGKDNF